MTNERALPRTGRRFGGDVAGTAGGSRPTQLRRLRAEDGYVLAMTALLILPLIVFVSFAIDLGVWYGQASRMQRAADAASLAAVVWLPNEGKAEQVYIDVARQNGFVTGGDVVVDGDPVGDTQYRVTITGTGTRFFSSTFEDGDQGLTRSALAEFNKPVPMGSPTSQMGNDLSNPACSTLQFQPSTAAPCGPNSMLWSSIQGPYELFQNGDPYTTVCARGVEPVGVTECSGGNRNGLYKPDGYEFGIEVGINDVGRTLSFEVWDPAVSVRQVGAGIPGSRTMVVTRSAGTRNLTRASGTATFSPNDLGETVTGIGIPAGSIITRVISTTQAQFAQTTSPEGTGIGMTGGTATTTITIGASYDCNRSAAPFTGLPYSALGSPNYGVTNQTCQTGDSTGEAIHSSPYPGSAFQVQVFDNDGADLTTNFDVPLSQCHLYIPRGDQSVYNKNRWKQVCTFIPTQEGVYPVRVKSSNITLPNGTAVPDTGSGWNAYSMRVTGGTPTTRMYALRDLSIWTNTPGSSAQFYLAEIGNEHAGKRLLLDLYDPGDGSGSSANYTMQVRMPPAGAPNIVPQTGTTIPSCRYNQTGSGTKGPATPQTSANCTITTRSGGSNLYNNNWLRIEIAIPTTYTCTTDCWWSIRYNFGGAGTPNDRTVWSITVVGDPVHLEE